MVLQLDIEAFVAVEPELAGQRDREINQLILPAHGDADLRASDLGSARARGERVHRDGQSDNGETFHFHRRSHRSSRATPALIINTTTASTVMPANTPVVSNVPSAC